MHTCRMEVGISSIPIITVLGLKYYQLARDDPPTQENADRHNTDSSLIVVLGYMHPKVLPVEIVYTRSYVLYLSDKRAAGEVRAHQLDRYT